MYPIFNNPLFWSIFLHFFCVLILLIISIKYIFPFFKNIPRNTWLILLLIFILGFLLRNQIYSHGPHTDGYVAQEAAKYWQYTGNFVKGCAMGNLNKCYLYHETLAPHGYPLLIFLTNFIFDYNSLHASIISAILSSFSIIITFLIAYILFNNTNLALLSSLFYAILPLNISLSQTGLAYPSSIFFTGLSVLYFLFSMKRPKQIIFWLTFISLFTFSFYIRHENPILILFFVFAGLFLLSDYYKIIIDFLIGKPLKTIFIKYKLKKYRKTILSIIFIFILLILGYLYWFFNLNAMLGHNKDLFGLKYFAPKSLLNLILMLVPWKLTLSFWQTPGFLSFISIMFFVGIFSAFSSKQEERTSLLFAFFWFLAYFMLYNFYFDEAFEVYSLMSFYPTTDFIRRTLSWHVPFSITAAYGSVFMFSKLRSKYIRNIFCLFLILYISINTVFLFQGFSFFTTRPFAYGRQHDCLTLLKDTPSKSTIITSHYMIATSERLPNNHRKAIDTNMLFDDPRITPQFFSTVQDSTDVFFIGVKFDPALPLSDQIVLARKYFDFEYIKSSGQLALYKLHLKKHRHAEVFK
ncbi:hypothetical protein ACFL5G_04455 [Candidatus Margulisiibacteriota bacterium]